jgi:hypothetical protein
LLARLVEVGLTLRRLSACDEIGDTEPAAMVGRLLLARRRHRIAAVAGKRLQAGIAGRDRLIDLRFHLVRVVGIARMHAILPAVRARDEEIFSVHQRRILWIVGETNWSG